MKQAPARGLFAPVCNPSIYAAWAVSISTMVLRKKKNVEALPATSPPENALPGTYITPTMTIAHLSLIILIRSWIQKQQHDPRYRKELFIAGKAHYPSTEAIAVMIAEEYLLASIGLLIAITWHIPELALAFGICHTLHLLVHIAEVLRYRCVVPGGITAVLTFPLLLFATYLKQQTLSWPLLLTLTLLLLAAILLNLAYLHRRAGDIDAWIHKTGKR